MSKHYASKVIAIALAEVGYHEKASNSQLDSKTANSGSANWNKYAAYIDSNAPDFYNGRKNGYDWCDIFNDYCHIKASDVETARKAIYQPLKSTGAGCPYSASFYRNNGAFINRGAGTPKPGDQIFFGTVGNEYHTGIVVDVDSKNVYTVEGNSSEQVAKRTYALTDSRIAGYGRPKYDSETSNTTTNPTNTSTATKTSIPDVEYRVRAGGKWYPAVKNLEDFAGVVGKAITDIAIKVSKGAVKYRVHVKGGSWLPWVTGYNINDSINGYAGNGKAIDAIEIYYTTPSDVVKSVGYLRAKYRVSPLNGSYYDYQYDNETSGSQDGYAGEIGKSIDRFQLILAK